MMSKEGRARHGSSGAVAVVVRAVPSWGLDSVIYTVAFAALGFSAPGKLHSQFTCGASHTWGR
jgi:hypothetical protein